MSEIKSCGGGLSREMVCIDTYRVLDSCRDKDCFEDVRVYLTDNGQKIIERASAVRTKCAKIEGANIDINPVPFNRGFYQLNIRLFIKIISEVCVSPGNIQELEGIAAVEKKVILFGSEGNVNVFKSNSGDCGFCSDDKKGCLPSSNLPIAVLETVDPIILNARIAEPRSCTSCTCCSVGEIPVSVCCQVNGDLNDPEDHDCAKLLVSIGLFSVVRLERPAQYLINATEYSVPDKECRVATESDPCSIFKDMSFPVQEFSPPSLSHLNTACDNYSSTVRKCSCSGN